MKKQNDTISRAAALELIKEIGGCDAQDQYGKGWNDACNELYQQIEQLPGRQAKTPKDWIKKLAGE